MLDTNVILDFVSCHDLSRAAASRQNVDYRRMRAKSALLLACHLHDRRMTTLTLHELHVKLKALVDPAEESLEGTFVRHVLYFVKDDVLRDWRWMRVGGSEGLEKTAADDEYLRIAREQALTLITNEDLTPNGVRSSPKAGSLRAKALTAGVPVFTPGELLDERQVDTARLTAGFFERWDARAAAYVAEHSKSHDDDIDVWMADARRVYEWVLRAP